MHKDKEYECDSIEVVIMRYSKANAKKYRKDDAVGKENYQCNLPSTHKMVNEYIIS
jgi:hypothetical protein